MTKAKQKHYKKKEIPNHSATKFKQNWIFQMYRYTKSMFAWVYIIARCECSWYDFEWTYVYIFILLFRKQLEPKFISDTASLRMKTHSDSIDFFFSKTVITFTFYVTCFYFITLIFIVFVWIKSLLYLSFYEFYSAWRFYLFHSKMSDEYCCTNWADTDIKCYEYKNRE